MHKQTIWHSDREAIGTMVDVDVEADDTGQENFLRVKIKIKLNKALARGRSITMQGKNLQIPLKY